MSPHATSKKQRRRHTLSQTQTQHTQPTHTQGNYALAHTVVWLADISLELGQCTNGIQVIHLRGDINGSFFLITHTYIHTHTHMQIDTIHTHTHTHTHTHSIHITHSQFTSQTHTA